MERYLARFTLPLPVRVEARMLECLALILISRSPSASTIRLIQVPWTDGDGPFRPSVNSTDGSVWVSDYAGGDSDGGMFQLDPYLRSSVPPFMVFNTAGYAGVGSGVYSHIYAPVANGSIANGNLVLYAYDYDLEADSTNILGGTDGAVGFGASAFNTQWEAGSGGQDGTITVAGETPCAFRWTVGSGSLPWNNPPDLAISTGISASGGVTGSMDVGPTGNIFVVCYRSHAGYILTNSVAPFLAVYDPTGLTNLFNSSYGPTNDIINDLAVAGGVSTSLQGVYSVRVSPDNKYAVLGGYYGWLGVIGLTNGIPDVSSFLFIPFANGVSRVYGVAMDAADNVYGLDNGTGALNVYDIGLTETCITSNDYTGTNGSFQIVRNGITAEAAVTASTAYQASNSWIYQQSNSTAVVPAIYNLTLSQPANQPVTVYFTLSGTATNTVNYTATTSSNTLPLATSNSVVFPAGVTSETITITPTTNPVSGPTLTVTLTMLNGGTVYSAASTPESVSIVNSGPQVLTLAPAGTASMYRGLSNDFATFYIVRYGDTNAAMYTIPTNSFNLAGTAQLGVDFLNGVTNSISVNPGDVEELAYVGDPVCTGVFQGNKSIIVSLNANAGVPVTGSTTLAVVDNMDPPAPVLWSDKLQSAGESINWTLTFANSNLASTVVPPIVIPNYPNYTLVTNLSASNYLSTTDPNYPGNGGDNLDDFNVEFGYDVTNDMVGYSPLMLINGWTNALKMTVNKATASILPTGHGASAGVNVYPQGRHFSGNYAFRFSMCLSEGTVNTTEFNTFGINHYGTNCDWFASNVSATAGNSTTNSDGLWYWIDSDVSGATAISTYTQVGGPIPLPNGGYEPLNGTLGNSSEPGAAAPYVDYYKNPAVYGAPPSGPGGPYNGVPAGAPSGGDGSPFSSWADVEVKQVNNLVTMSINKLPILSYYNNNSGTYKYSQSGDVMLGYDDPFASIGSSQNLFLNPGAAVYYVNARVVELTPPAIISSAISGTTLTITFSDSDTDDTTASFKLLGASVLNGTWTQLPATFSQLPNGSWQAVVTVTGSPQFFDVVRL